MAYTVNPGAFGAMFAVPAQVADNYLKLASASQLKTMLWIFRHPSEPVDPAVLSEETGYSEADINDALTVLTEWGILSCDGKSVNPAPLADNSKKPDTGKSAKALPDIAPVRPSYEQVVARCGEDPDISNMFNDIQALLGKTIGYDSECILLMMHDIYGLPKEVIYMLVNYCVEIGKGNFSYIAKVGKTWGEKEIDTIDKADEQIKELNACTAAWKEFAAMAGIQNPRPSSSQSAYLRTWTKDMKFSIEMIYSAYEEMLDHSSRLSFPYINKVLSNWYDKGIKTPEDIEKDKTEYRKKHSGKNIENIKKTSYNMDEFNKKAERLPVYKKGDK